MKFILGGGLERDASEGRRKWRCWGLPKEKIFMSAPLRSMENTPFLENQLSTETKDHNQWESFQENL